MTRCARWLPFTLLPALLVSAAQAQGGGRSARVLISPELGVHAGRQFHDDEWIVGGYFRMPLYGGVDLRPSGDMALGPSKNYQLNGDIALHGPRDLAYLGAGVAWVHRDFSPSKESGVGYNLFIGFKPFPQAGGQLYIEGRLTKVESKSLFRAVLGGAFRL